jgi:tetrapyrrole methylase family protein/MazG family protein
MQIVLHAQIASEAGEFEIDDVINNISMKLVNRHPHVFGSVKVRNAGDVLANWEAIKKEEREHGVSMLENTPRQLPALSYSQEVQDRVARVGFDWPDVDGVIEKLAEEVDELKQAESQEQRESEFGDLLFTLTNVARRMGIDSESALRRANRKFYRRFSYMEELCHKRGTDFSRLTLDEKNALWEEAKREVR